MVSPFLDRDAIGFDPSDTAPDDAEVVRSLLDVQATPLAARQPGLDNAAVDLPVVARELPHAPNAPFVVLIELREK
jgi:hypothetical protein